ncbi:hypothetical protein [Candidatus Mycoplasma haematohominis]|uniref:Uncharacterized protein n=1 Tax=Candidatus Mycoplasma haematohominis TaxID=1494318 RepID=A0A478FU03_9MOLU|nr:hypothetical protein [Candidatus Mycoplasma haemohominis]GCE63575.1 hypothetical protein MHSWG343_05720 [Candidatus Mycoplasma haemohominis]
MSATVKGAAALGATAVVVGGTGVGAKFLLDAQEPHCVRLKSPATGKYGEDYKRYFAESNGSENDKWWNWVFKNRYEKDTRDSSANRHEPLSKFKSLESGSGVDKSLKKVCGEAYADEKANVVVSSSAKTDNTKYSEEDVWRYCSIFGNKPKTLREVKADDVSRKNNTFAKTKEDVLIDIADPANQRFWDEQNTYFFGLKETELNAGEKSIFKALYKKQNKGQEDTIKNVCEEAYKKQSTVSDGSTTDAELLKFCSLKGK